MSAWTPEPWQGRNLTIVAKNITGGTSVIADMPDDTLLLTGTWNGNRDRIVLCVNALAGMTETEIDTMRQIWKERER